MRCLIVVGAIASLAPRCLAQAAPGGTANWNFAGLPWGADREAVKRTLAAKGYSFVKTDEDGDQVYNGTISDRPAKIFAMFGGDGLAKTQVTIVTPDNKARDVFRDMRETMLAKYGTPDKDYHFFVRPYYEGDGYEDQAIRLGKGVFAVFWTRDGQGGEDNIYLGVSERLNVDVAYESPQWKAEVDRRKARATKDF